MSIELLSLIICALLCLAFPLFYGALYSKQVGLAVVTGNRDDVPGPTGMAGRAQRAHSNLVENLVPYAAVVLAAHALQAFNSLTAIAAMVFVGARLVHALSYIAGITGLRTLAWNVGVLATIFIAVQVFLR